MKPPAAEDGTRGGRWRWDLVLLLALAGWLAGVRVADHAHVLSRGRIVHSSSPAELMADEEVKSRFLGLGS